MRTNKLEDMLQQMGKQEALESNKEQVPADIQAELQDVYQAIGKGQSADGIREQLARKKNISESPMRQRTDLFKKEENETAITPTTMKEVPIKRRTPRLARYGAAAAAVVLIGVGSVISSAFFSADMARTLKQLPGTSQFYQLTSQWGWTTADEKETTKAQPTVEQDGIKLTLRSLLYDGKKVNIELEQQAQKQHGVQQVEIYVDGRQVSSIYNKTNKEQVQDANTSTYMLQRELELAPLINVTDMELGDMYPSGYVPASALPKQIDMQVKITLQGMTDKPFIYDMHAEQNPLPNYSLSNTLRTPEGIGYHQAAVEATPVMTYIDLTTSYSEKWEKWSYNYYLKHGYYPLSLTYTLTDSENHVYRTNSHSGRDPHTFLEFDPIIGQPKQLIITPWEFNEEPIENHRKVPISAENHINLPLTLDMGTTGKVTLLEVDSTPDQYILRIMPEKAYQTYTTAVSFWYGTPNQKYGVYGSEFLPDPDHEGQLLIKFDKSKLKKGAELHYSVDKITYRDPLYLKRNSQP